MKGESAICFWKDSSVWAGEATPATTGTCFNVRFRRFRAVDPIEHEHAHDQNRHGEGDPEGREQGSKRLPFQVAQDHPGRGGEGPGQAEAFEKPGAKGRGRLRAHGLGGLKARGLCHRAQGPRPGGRDTGYEGRTYEPAYQRLRGTRCTAGALIKALTEEPSFRSSSRKAARVM